LSESEQCRVRLVAQCRDAFFGGVEAEQRNIGRFSLHRILAGVFAEALRGPFDVQHVIDDLKAKPTAAA